MASRRLPKPAPPVPAGPPRPCSLWKLRLRGCRYIIAGEGLAAVFCNQDQEMGCSWCLPHRKIVFVKR